MDYQSLNDGCVVLGRCGRAGSDGVKWEGQRKYTLSVFKDKNRRNCLIVLRDKDDFTDFDPRYDMDGNILVSEDYYFEAVGVLANPQS